MGLNFNAPLPGPFSVSKRIGGGGRRSSGSPLLDESSNDRAELASAHAYAEYVGYHHPDLFAQEAVATRRGELLKYLLAGIGVTIAIMCSLNPGSLIFFIIPGVNVVLVLPTVILALVMTRKTRIYAMTHRLLDDEARMSEPES